MRSRPTKRRPVRRRSPLAPLKISCWAKTDVGQRREHNEDSHLMDPNLNLFIVADGMGGHAGGDTASRMAVEIVRDRVHEANHQGDLFSRQAIEAGSPAILKMLEGAIKEASEAIYAASDTRPELTGMGTTTTLLLLVGKRGYVAHVGDSRLYRYRRGKLEQMSEDHSLVNEQVKAGFITAEEAQYSRFRNIITRSVGFESDVTADTFTISLESSDTYFLCSDGLSGMVSDKDISRIFSSGSLAGAVERLVAEANQNGGEDNITVIALNCKNGTGGSTLVRRKPRRQRKQTPRKRSEKF